MVRRPPQPVGLPSARPHPRPQLSPRLKPRGNRAPPASPPAVEGWGPPPAAPRPQHGLLLLAQVFEDAVVRRVDESLGLLCELPSSPGTAALTPGYAHISSVADDKVELLAKVCWASSVHGVVVRSGGLSLPWLPPMRGCVC